MRNFIGAELFAGKHEVHLLFMPFLDIEIQLKYLNMDDKGPFIPHK